MHTPGPWTALGYDGRYTVYRDDTDEVLARNVAPRNVALIVNAPTILKALIALAAEFDQYDNHCTRFGHGHEDYGKQRENARLAIALAIHELGPGAGR